MARVTGIGGIFMKTADPAATRAWYAEHLGMATDDFGCTFAFDPDPLAQTIWSPVQRRDRLFRSRRPAVHGQFPRR